MMLAWISVHDHVAGGKLRELAKDIGCSQKEALGILVSLWLWGLNNADSIIKLMYGKEYGIRIYSTAGEGTKVTITIPLDRQDGNAGSEQ